jgi:uncharacterized PurR-regulated membrane protein YhhQ (DUF165 family)
VVRDSRKVTVLGALAFLLFCGTIVGANWMIAHVGQPIPGGHLLPVGFDLKAPSGVYLAGAAFIARDFVQRALGPKYGFAAIVVGALISVLVSSPTLALASGLTFLVSESTDFLIFTPLQKKSFPGAVLLAGVVSDVVDSYLFLTLAHIPLQIAFLGQVVGKTWVTLLGAGVSYLMRRSSFLSISPGVRGA